MIFIKSPRFSENAELLKLINQQIQDLDKELGKAGQEDPLAYRTKREIPWYVKPEIAIAGGYHFVHPAPWSLSLVKKRKV